MGKFTGWLTTLALGAGLMYLYDPDRGSRRRSLVRDRFSSLKNDFDDALDVGVRDLRNQAQGLVAETSSMFSKEKPGDHIVEERIRSRLGYMVPNASAIEVTVHDGAAQLSGDILAQDVDSLMKGVARIRGVSSVENKLSVHDKPGNIPSLQGLERARERQEQAQQGWMPGTRLLAGVGASTMILYGRFRGGVFGRLYNLGGWVLLFRTITNKPLKRSLGLNDDRSAITINRSMQIDVPVEEVYEFWNNFTNFPKFMENITEVKDKGDGHYHWVAKGPAGVPVEWDAVVTENEPNKRIAWESVPASEVKTVGSVDFEKVKDGTTQVNVHMSYTPPAGVLGHAVAQLFGQDPESAMIEDMNRMRSLLIDGKTTVDGKEVTRGQASKPRNTRSS
jgi:uncharacterized membrane protein